MMQMLTWRNMIEVFKIVHIYYESEVAVKLNFNTFCSLEVYQFVCERDATPDAGKENYLRLSEHIGLDKTTL